ncbi:GNAT family N-acetyltransferase [Oceanobacillus sp. J11TS1]|uniref:GNAT family N-acetyltransferase n=1 Tax=Oceanobacillus sp. J11TS1 TaxID=2807191 RepID=UPI001B141B41|nr:GNAT family N-acetyltransferase [Oceanobacillus sp. J11TS1]GIO24897.1 alanine acetyltransferase [Oceanobacillus sp. J11TS1]
MLKIRDLNEVPMLFELMIDPEVFPFVRQKATTVDEFYFLTKQTLEAEERGELISRTILDEYQHPIGTINLFDIEDNYGFLATWIGKPYFGKGYNRLAKDAFFQELFTTKGIDGIFMKVRKNNQRSQKAVLKLPYVTFANDLYETMYHRVNSNPDEPMYDLFVISKEHFLSYQQFQSETDVNSDEEVS